MSQNLDETRILNDESHLIPGSEDDNSMEELSGCAALPFCNPNAYLHRLIALILMCLFGFASNFAYDNPSALETNLKHDLNITTTEFGMLYSVYSWPNVIMCFIGGFLIDRVFGIRWGSNIYTFLAMIGQVVFAVGAMLRLFWLMLVGRFIFGIGSENIQIAQNYYAVLWFEGKELNMAFGVQNSFSNIGSIVNFLVMEPFYNFVKQYYSKDSLVGIVLLITSATAILSMIVSIILSWMDRRAKRILRRNDNPNGEVAKLSDVKSFSLVFWMVTVVYVCYNLAITPFVSLANRFLEQIFHYSPEDADRLISIGPLLSAITSPFFGWFLDKTGQNVTWIFLSTVVTVGGHLMLAFCDMDPFSAIFAIGLANAMLSTGLAELVALICPKHQLGTAFGVLQAAQNLGLAIVAMLEGIIVDRGGFVITELFFIAWLCVTIIAITVIWIKDIQSGGYLNMTPNNRQNFLKKLRDESSDFENTDESVDIVR